MENKTSKYAVASLILGIFTIALFPTVIFSIPTGVLAIVFGVMAKNEDHGANQSNKGLGIGGIVTGSVGLLFTLLMIIYVLFSFVIGYAPRGYRYQYNYDYGTNEYYDYFDDYGYEYYLPEIEQ